MLKLKIYNIFFLPFMNYCCVVWGSSAGKHFISKISVMQKKVLRMVFSLDHETGSPTIYQKSKSLKEEENSQMQNFILIFRYTNGQLPMAC